MIRHIVCFKFKSEAEGKTKQENLIYAKQIIDALIDQVDVLKAMEVGINDAEASDNNFDLVLTSDFDTLEDLNTYQVHPDHQKVVTFMKKVVEARACVDYRL